MGAVSKNKDIRTSSRSDAQKSEKESLDNLHPDIETSDSLDIATSKHSIQTDVSMSKNSDVQTSEHPRQSNIGTSKHSNIQTSKAKSSNPDYTRTTIYLPKKMHKKLKAIAVEEEREMSEIVEELLGEWLESR